MLKSLSMGVMGRYEDYQSFGSKTVWKFNTNWHVNEAIALRGTIRPALHAPCPGHDTDHVVTP